MRRITKQEKKENMSLVLAEAKEQYNLHLGQFDDIVKKNNVLILANTIMIGFFLANSTLLKLVFDSGSRVLLIFVFGMLLLFGSLFASLISLDLSMLKIPKITRLYSFIREHTNVGIMNALAKEYVNDINYNSSKYMRKSKWLNRSSFLLQEGVLVMAILTVLIIRRFLV